MNDQWSRIDPLGEALHFLRMSSTIYSRCEFTAPWALELPEMHDTLMFHVVTSGACWLEVEGAGATLLQSGDLALVPHGEGHRLASKPGTLGRKLADVPREYVSERYEIIRHGGGGTGTGVICGTVHYDHLSGSHLLRVLPKVISIEAAGAHQTGWIQSTLRFMADEAMALRPGGETVITRLADVLVIQAIRSWIEQDPAPQTGWLGSLRDQQIGKAIALIHNDPAHPWTVATLAAEVAMSRSAFAARFTSLVGEPPMQYVARWRMHLALRSLKEDKAAVSELAMRLGYQSEAAFSRAFKRIIGVSPGTLAVPRRNEKPASGERRTTRRSFA